MKFLLMFFVFVVLLFQWRHARSDKVSQVQRKKASASGPVSMVACARCGLHLPAGEAVQGKRGVYCSAAHKLAQEP
jgi:uncharacterized protein